MIFKNNNTEYIGDKYILGMSGGKDSTAMAIYMLFELEIPREQLEFVFMDTGWEAEITYKYLQYLEQTLDIQIIRLQADYKIKEEHQEIYNKIKNILGKDSNMVKQILNQRCFPSGRLQWCTKQLKIIPLKKYYDSVDFEPINTVGIRREESHKRSTYTEYEYNDFLDCWVYRPLIDMTTEDIINLHHKYNVLPNSLYIKNNQQRVGCYPCIRSNKKELANFKDEKIIEVITILEEYLTKQCKKPKTFFKGKNIKEVLEWARTSRGGKQFYLFNLTTPECKRWGMCGI
jgi:3'-phosphoadenosine 5'-phosphosulfate sulfotransferase (PAPS reductase)/FAD synthetase